MDLKIEEVTGDKHPSTLYSVSMANIEGSRIYCWYRVPEGDGPFPGLLTVPGAGVRKEGTRESYAENGYAVITMAIHGIGQDHELDFYDRMRSGLLAGYPFFGMEDPYRFYYRRVILGALRCLDFLESRPEVDSERIVMAGSSQGGGMSLLVTALDKRIKALAGNVPALCDHTGRLHGRPSGWPRLLRRASEGEQEQVIRTAGYYDAALAASRIDVPALLSCGLIDGTCAPTTVLAAFNNLRGPRGIEIVPGMGHSFSSGWDKLSLDWLRDALEGKTTGTKIFNGKIRERN
jgi:cephalosporin-C deacetylase-like acetyl esterase